MLISHGDTGEHEDLNYNSTPRRIYYVAQISILSDLLQVEKLINVPYQSVRYMTLQSLVFTCLLGHGKDFQSF